MNGYAKTASKWHKHPIKDAVKEHLPDIMSSRHAVRYGGLFVYIKKAKADVHGYTGYAYIGGDADSRNRHMKRAAFNSMDDKLSGEKTERYYPKPKKG